MTEYSREPFNPYSLRTYGRNREVIKTNTGVNFNLDRKYSYIKCIGIWKWKEWELGEGSYGVVISVTNNEDHVKYAIKKIPNVLQDVGNGFRVYREIKIMKYCYHPNVLRLVDVEVDPPTHDYVDL